MEDQLYLYRAELVRVIDGDTYDLKVDVGFYGTFAHRFRLYNWDTPEIYRGSDYEKQKAQEAKTAVEDWFASIPKGMLFVRTYKADSFGRWLADIIHGVKGQQLSAYLQAKELATEWPTRWREVYDIQE